MKKILQRIGPILGLVLFVAAFLALHRALKEYHYHDVARELKGIPADRLLLALGLTILNYVALTAYDSLAFRYIRHPLSYKRIAPASFVSYAFSHNLGLSFFSGASVRYRLYSSWGLSAVEITKVVAFCGLTFWIGFFTVGGVVFLFEPLAVPKLLHLPFSSIHPLGVILLLLVAGYLLWNILKKKPFRFRQWELPFPSVRISIAQIIIGSLDWMLAGSILYMLLPYSKALSYPGFLGIFLLAQMAGFLSQVPGGLGVFETLLILLLSPEFPASSVLGSLLVFRGMYYFLPLGVAVTLLGIHEAIEKKEGFQRLARTFGQWVPEMAPPVFAVTTFLGGVILLLSGATPAIHSRLAWLDYFLPLSVIEVSHFLGSIAGVGLLLLARGIQQRLDAAYFLTIVSLIAGIIFSLLRGVAYEEAIALTVLLGALLPCRRHFYRKASLTSEAFTFGWISAIVLVLLGSVWLGMFSYKHLEYSSELWWRFVAIHGDAPRFLRATAGSVGVALIFAVAKLLSVAPGSAVPGADDIEKARAIVAASPKTYGNLALLGDKAFLFSEKKNAFIMYSIEGRSWIAMGDPVGPREETAELVWRFREMCDRNAGWTVFYEISKENLHLYLDIGLTLLKIGEEGTVGLADFSLEGGSRKGLRYTHHKLEKEGYTFEVIPRDDVPPILPELKEISDAWLHGKNTREKRFSLGFFSAEYLTQFPAALVRNQGRIVAFANMLLGGEKEELSIDLMRYRLEGERSVTEYLLIELMLWGRQQGYQWFSLGMAPLSGLEDRALAPLWDRLGAFVFRHGEHFYNFQGLRVFKDKFGPEWEPKYIACAGGLALPRVLTDIASLVSGGLKGVIAK